MSVGASRGGEPLSYVLSPQVTNGPTAFCISGRDQSTENGVGFAARLAFVADSEVVLPRGWYEAESDLRVEACGWPLQSLHLDRVGDDSQLGILVPVGLARRRPSVVLALPRATDRLYMDLGGGRPVARPSWLRLRPISLPRAAMNMFMDLVVSAERRRPARRVRVMIKVIVSFFRGMWRNTLAELGTEYQAALAADLGAEAGVGVRLRMNPWLPVDREALLIPDDPPSLYRATRPGEWESVGLDPKFDLILTDGRWPLDAGWYRVRIRSGASGRAIAGTYLYVDFGLGAGPGRSLCLGAADADGQIDSLVLLESPVHGLQIHLGTRSGRFAVHAFRLDRVGRWSALLRMVSGFPAKEGRGQMASVLAGFVEDLIHSGSKHAVLRLKRLYDSEVVTEGRSYMRWVEQYDTFTEPRLVRLRARAKSLLDGPLISVIVPVYETPETWLRRCIESVTKQAYPNWELCLADDASSSRLVARVLHEYAAHDDRIKVVHRESRGHISVASNSALALASGDFIALLDHDDELSPNALLEVVEFIRAHPNAGLLYSDEDKIDEHGQRFEPYFKPEWNLDLLRGQNYICHLTVVRASIVREVGGFRAGMEGSQDHDLVLRCTERLGADQVIHVPKILYHWRAIAGSTALHGDAKDYASLAGAKALSEHLARIDADASVDMLPHGHYRVRWRLPSPAPRVTLIIPTRDRVELLKTCVESIASLTTYPNYEILVVDNQSEEPAALEYLDSLARRDRITVLRYDKPFNYSAINNWAARRTTSDILGFVNNDIEVIHPDWLEEMASQAWRPEIGAVGAMLYYPDNRIQHAGVILGLCGVARHAYAGYPKGYPGYCGRARVCQNLSAVTAACMLVARKVFDQVGGLDEQLRVDFNDVDFCLRVRSAGYVNLWTPFAELYHHESASRGSEDSVEKQARLTGDIALMEKRWGSILRADPAYNPNLTLTEMDFAPAFPPRVD